VPPQVNISAPNGGEIVDTGSSFAITWNAYDDVALSKQDVLLSTDGGASFNPIVTGLSGTVNQYAWIAPTIANNQTARVRVVGYDTACNVGRADSEANFQLWNRGGPLPHVAEAPIFMSSGGFRSIIHLCNASPNSATVELSVRNRYGTALAAPPVQFTLSSGQVRAIDVANYLLPGAPPDSGDPNISMGSIRLRHNGSGDSDVRAIVAVDRNNEDDSFTVPFVYAASAQSPSSTMQCSPLYYVDNQTSALLSLQNITNGPVPVSIALHYGTGASGTANGTYYLPSFTLAAQQTLITNLANYAGQVQGTCWGSITLNAPSQSVVAHTVMMSRANHFAFNSSFVDPAMCSNTTKVASTLKLDYAMGLKACVMVCNMSATDTRTVTASFKTNNGVVLPSRQVTLAPGQQNLIELDSQALLAPGSSTMANVSLSYSGNASDIIASAVSMSAANHCAIPAQFVELHRTDGRHLVAPFFRFDERTSGFLQISNFGAADVKAGVTMKFADTTLPMLNTDLITVAAGGTATIDLQSYFALVDDTITAQGCVEVIHNGASGTIAATFTALGKYNDLSLEVPLEAGPPFASNAMQMFPNNVELATGDGTTFSAMTGENLNAPGWSVSSTVGKPGSITPTASTAQYVYPASYVSAPDPNTIAVTVRADATSSGGPVQSGSITIEKVKVLGFTTSSGGRINPDVGTSFTITGKSDWPSGPLTVKFKQGDLSTGEVSASTSPSDQKVLTGTAPANTLFIGDCQVIVLQDGTKISKDNSGAAYYSFNPPSLPTSVSPTGLNRQGGNVTITAQGGGFKEFTSTATQKRVEPKVEIGELDFEVNTVSSTQINGNVLRAPNRARCCDLEGQTPCLSVRATNPGGRTNDGRSSSVPLYNLLPGPAPAPQSRFPDFGFSIGGSRVTIRGQNLDFVDSVTIGGTDAPIISKTATVLEVTTRPHTAGANNAIILFDVCPTVGGVTVQGGGFRIDPTPIMELAFPNQGVYVVGPGEGVDLQGGLTISQNISCIIPAPGSNIAPPSVTVTPVPPPSPFLPEVLAFRAIGSYDCRGCTCSAQNPPCPTDISGTITYRLVNTAAPNDSRLRLNVQRTPSVRFDLPPPPGLPRTCSGSF